MFWAETDARGSPLVLVIWKTVLWNPEGRRVRSWSLAVYLGAAGRCGRAWDDTCGPRGQSVPCGAQPREAVVWTGARAAEVSVDGTEPRVPAPISRRRSSPEADRVSCGGLLWAPAARGAASPSSRHRAAGGCCASPNLAGKTWNLKQRSPLGDFLPTECVHCSHLGEPVTRPRLVGLG